MTELRALLELAEAALPTPTPAQREIVTKLQFLCRLLDDGALRVAVLGQFKRGKSTLLNAILGMRLLPTAIVPVTGLPIFLRAGRADQVRLKFRDNHAPERSASGPAMQELLALYTTEIHNPENVLRVDAVEVTVTSGLPDGIILIDTPGVGSTFIHNTAMAEAMLIDCDAGLFVLSPDPPITEVELSFLRKVKALVPKIAFVLNKIDLLDETEMQESEAFLRGVLDREGAWAAANPIFLVSARQALAGKENGDREQIRRSRIEVLERYLARDLMQEKRTILQESARLRALLLVADLLFLAEMQEKALRAPEEELKHKIAVFESAIVDFSSERQALSDYMVIERNRLVKMLEADTDVLWRREREKVEELVVELTRGTFDNASVRARVAEQLARQFERFQEQLIDACRERLSAQLAAHRARAGALVNRVRAVSAQLMEIDIALPEPMQVFELKHEAYWVAPEPAVSLGQETADALEFLLPGRLRLARARRQISADSDRAVLRNVANLEWSLRQNIDNAFRRFEGELSERMSGAIDATRQAMEMALEMQQSGAEITASRLSEAIKAKESISKILKELRGNDAESTPIESATDPLIPKRQNQP
jgi:GTPase Era involved in 16S rRNA processing